MQLFIKIECEVSDGSVRADIVEILQTMLPYMADNVIVSSTAVV